MEEPISPAYNEKPKNNMQTLAIPLAIVFGFGLIAIAIFFSGNPFSNLPSTGTVTTTQENNDTDPIEPVSSEDHFRGNPNAPVVIVEYSDFDCPYCKSFHETMQLVMQNYGADGKVAWVYRHLPLEQLHPSAPYIASASECVAELGGDDAFWKFADLIFGERSIGEFTNTTRLGEFAETAGVDKSQFQSCLDSQRTEELVEADFIDGISAGANGTPYSVMLVAGEELVINGAQPYEYVSSVLDTVLEQIENSGT